MGLHVAIKDFSNIWGYVISLPITGIAEIMKKGGIE